MRLTAAPEWAALTRGRWPWRRHRDPAEEDGPAIVGWLGGLPVLPEGVVWPAWQGHGPLAHVATLDCAGLWAVLPGPLRDAGFPDQGWLSFFYFDGSADGGVEVVGSLFAGTRPGAQVIYSPEDRAAGTAGPAGVPLYRRVELAAEPVLTWATWEHPRLYAGRGRPAEGWDAVFGAAAEVIQHLPPGPAHQVGGNPVPVQGSVEVEVAYGQISRGGLETIAWTGLCPDTRPYARYLPASGYRRLSHLSTRRLDGGRVGGRVVRLMLATTNAGGRDSHGPKRARMGTDPVGCTQTAVSLPAQLSPRTG